MKMNQRTYGNWDFIIPLTKEDLLKEIEGQYYVKKLIDEKTCLEKMREIKKDISNEGCQSILNHFDVLYSILCEKDNSFSQLQEIYDIAVCRLIKDVEKFVRDALKVEDYASKQEAVNVIKMNLYIFSMFFKCYEDKLSFNSENFFSEPKRSKTIKQKSKSVKSEDVWDWNMQKKNAFTKIFEMLQQKLFTLWNSQVVEESLVNLIANCCYKALENPDIVQARLKPLRDSVSEVLAVLVASYNHGISFIPKAIQLMKQSEHAAPAVSATIILMATEYKCITIIPKILKELTGCIEEEDIPGLAKSTAIFITDIAETDAELLLDSIKILTRNLAVESYFVRNASLVAFTEIITKCLSAENIEPELRNTRNHLLKCLHNHLRDQNSYVRSKVLQLWSKLVSAHVIPKYFFMTMLQGAKNRISDKSFMAVKNAIQLFTVVLKENPYAGRLNITDMRGQLLQAKTVLANINAKRTLPREEAWADIEVDLILEINKFVSNQEEEDKEKLVSSQSVNISDVLIIVIKLLQEKHFSEAIELLIQSELQFPNAQEIRCNMDKKSDPVEYYAAVFKKIFIKTPDIYGKIPLNFDNFNEEYNKQKAVVDYIQESLTFASLMEEIGKEISKILKSKSVMGVIEAIEFFTVAYQFGVADSKRVMRSILLLVRCDQPTIKDAVGVAYRKLYLTSTHTQPKAKAMQTAHRLIKLLKDLDIEQKIALEELIDLWMKNDELGKDFIQVLWEKFDKKKEETSDEESVSALILLDMMALKTPSLTSSNVQLLIDTGLKKHSNLMIVEYTCKMLTKLNMIKVEGKFMRLAYNHELFEEICKLLVTKFDNTSLKGYKPMCLAAVTMISKICYYPEKVLDKLVKDLYFILCNNNENVDEGNPDVSTTETGVTLISVKESILERFFLIHGEILLRKWQYLNNDVVSTLVKSGNYKEGNKENENVELDELEAEYQDAQNDALMRTVTELCEELITDDNSINSYVRDLVNKVCISNRDEYSTCLKVVAATTLAKYMMVSQNYCEQKIQLLVTLMEKSEEEVVRGNLVLSFGDLLMRYPNVIEPWSAHLFTRLEDKSTLVRKNAVVVICHLVTREMVKVRGHVSEICLCLEDKDHSISEQVHSLFMDLARKGNTLYNIIPDIISRLSTPDRVKEITPDIFDRIMKFILGLIGKERQNEQLVDKLCVRICESDDTRQWRDLAFCLTQLNITEKSLRRLIDSLSSFNERLLNNEIHNAIVTIFNNAQKSSKQTLKDLSSEGLSKIEELINGTSNSSNSNTDSDKLNNINKVFMTPLKTLSSAPNKIRSTRKLRKPIL